MMKRVLVLVACCLALLLPASLARAERLVSQLSTDLIEITSSYDGEQHHILWQHRTRYGRGAAVRHRHIQCRHRRHRPIDQSGRAPEDTQLGVWLNTDQVVFEYFPSFFHVLASDQLLDITNPTTLAVENILPEAQPDVQDEAGWWKSSVFGRELVRLMTEKGFFGLHENAVQFLSNTFYTARLTLPSEAPPGPYLATTYVFKNGEIVAQRAEGFAVRKTGFERFIAISATQQPFFYGLVCVILALFTGWLGGVIFKR
jgi:uncharacterized protein (TIGR02186 family)